MGFSVVHGSPQTVWVPVLPGDTIYTGALVGWDIATPLEGVIPLAQAAGHGNTTNKDRPYGVVVGNNNVSGNVNYNSTHKAEYITEVAAGSIYGSTTKYANVEGPWAKGDPLAMVEVALINANTVLSGPIYDTAAGTALAPVTVSTPSGGDGIGCTTGETTVATVANFSTIYARSGANMGVYRTLTSASTTAHVWLTAMKNDMAVGDTAVVLNGLRPNGAAKMQIDAEGMFIDCNAALTSDNFWINVLRLDLSEPGNEYCEFQFDGDNFSALRA